MKKVTLDQLTGKQFKTLVEEVTTDGKLNTLPELFQFLSEVPDGMTLKAYIESIAGGGGQPAHDSVGSEEIKNDSIEMEDLNHEVKEKMLTDDDRVTTEELNQFEV